MASSEISASSSSRLSAPSIAPAPSSEAPRVDEAAKTVFDENFERAKPTHEYGLGWLKYGVLSQVSGRLLSEERQTKVDLYSKHAALRAGVVKVKTAFQSFIAAEKTVQQAKDPSSLGHAQAEERRQAKRLMSTYNDLVALATTQARELGVSEIAYRGDLHRELNKKSDGLIFYTINRIAGRYCLDSKLEAEEGFEKSYVQATSHLVLNIQAAFSASGEQATIQMITEAFIEGLASLPEFAQDPLSILDCYMALAKLRNPTLETDKALLKQLQKAKDKLEKTIIADFLEQLNKLLDSEAVITMADIRKITSHGIRLFQWRVFTEAEVDRLNNLRTLKASLKVHEEVLESDCDLIADSKQILQQEHTFEIREICEFFGFCIKGAHKQKQFLSQIDQALATVPADDTLLGFNEFKKVIMALAEIEQKIAALNKEADREIGEFSQKLTVQKQKITHLTEKYSLYIKAIKENLEKITSLEQELSEFIKSFQELEQIYHSLSQTEKSLLELNFGAAFIQSRGKRHLEDVKERTGKIDEQKDQLQSLQNQIAQLQVDRDQASTALEEMEEIQAKAEAHYSKSFLPLKDELNKLAKTTIRLSGKAIGVMGEGLGIETVPIFLTGANSVMASPLITHLELSGLKQERKVDARWISELTTTISEKCSSLGLQYDESEQNFAFQPAERVQIQQFVNTNLDIAAEVTARLLDKGGQTRRQTSLRQLVNQSEEGKRFREQIAGQGLYPAISSRIYSLRSADEAPELGIEVFEMDDEDVFAF